MYKTKVLILISLLLSLFILGCLTANVDDDESIRSFQVEILMDVEFNRLHIRESGAVNTIHTQTGQFNKGSYTIRLNAPLDPNTRYDIQLQTPDGTTATKRHVSILSQNSIVEFDISDFDDETANEVTAINILNRTGIDFSYVLVSVTGSSSWLFRMDGNFTNDTHTPVTNITPPLNNTIRYDVQLRDHPTGTIRATRTNILLTQNRNVIFTENNLD